MIIITLLLLNYIIAKLLVKLTIKLSSIYVQNSQILAPTIKKEMYEIAIGWLVYNIPLTTSLGMPKL